LTLQQAAVAALQLMAGADGVVAMAWIGNDVDQCFNQHRTHESFGEGLGDGLVVVTAGQARQEACMREQQCPNTLNQPAVIRCWQQCYILAVQHEQQPLDVDACDATSSNVQGTQELKWPGAAINGTAFAAQLHANTQYIHLKMLLFEQQNVPGSSLR
jgi:hypothetical protein